MQEILLPRDIWLYGDVAHHRHRKRKRGEDMGNFESVFSSLQLGLPIFLLHLFLAILIWIAAMVIDSLVTPYHKMEQIRAGNTAAALAAGGGALGVAIPLAACLAGSVNGWDIVLWGVSITAVQLAAYWSINLFVPRLSERLDANDLAAAIFLVLLRLGIACLNAAAIAA